MKCVKIIVSPRLHLGLISMHAGASRKNGGIGFSISDPKILLEITTSKRFQFKDHREVSLTNAEICQIANLIDASIERFALNSNICVKLTGKSKTHVGLGTGTAIRLAVLEGLFCINDKSIPDIETVKQSKRGGTSGIGINTYFSGGLILDLGVPNDYKEFAPSSRVTPSTLPIKLPSLKMPAWPLCVCIPRFILPKTQQEEIDFFTRVAPVSPADSYEAAYHALFGAYAAAVEQDFASFVRAVEAIQLTTWKKQEWSEYGISIYNLASMLRELGAKAIGMSSLGPMLFCLGNKESISRISKQGIALNCEILKTVPENTGRILICE